MVVFFLLFLGRSLAQSTDATLRSTNSVDIQVCVNSAFLTPLRGAFQSTLMTTLQSLLASNALYLDRQYTTLQGTLCYLYVYQAPNPSMAVAVLEQLSLLTTLDVNFNSAYITCSINAAQWSGDQLSYLGAPFPVLWTFNDLILWGACLLSLLFLCMSGICCYALCKVQETEKEQPQEETTRNKKILKLDGSSTTNHQHLNKVNLKLKELHP